MAEGNGSRLATVLIVDDNVEDRHFVAEALVEAGYDVLEAESADEALQLANNRPDLIVLTLKLPDARGVDITRRLRADPLTSDIPILQRSSEPVEDQLLAQGLQAGASMHLGNSTSPSLLVASVDALLRFRDRQRELEVALSVRGSGIFEWAIPTGEVRWSESLERVHGLEPGTFAGTYEAFLDHVHPSELDRIDALLQELIDRGDELVMMYQGVRADGSLLWIESHGRAFRNARGVATKLTGFALDVTERESNSRRVQQLQELAGDFNVADTTAEVLAAAHKALSDYGHHVDLYASATEAPPREPGVIRHRAEHFVLDVHPPAGSSVSGRLEVGAAAQVSAIIDLAVSALRRAWRYDMERQTAATLQRALLPARLPSPDGWQVDALYEPTSAEDRLGGDFYDVIEIGDLLVAVIGDVAGHGLAATAQMSSMRNLLRTLAIEHGGEPEVVLGRASALAPQQLADPHAFITAAVAAIDTITGELTVASAGHPPCLLHTEGGTRLIGSTTGPPLGTRLEHGGPGVRHSDKLAPGETLILFTDGVIECRDEPLEVSLERLRVQLADHGDDIGPDVLISLGDDSRLNPDDRAIVTIRRTHQEPSE